MEVLGQERDRVTLGIKHLSGSCVGDGLEEDERTKEEAYAVV